MIVKKSTFLLLIIFLCVIGSFAQTIIESDTERYYPEFYILESNFDPGEFITGDLVEQEFVKYMWGKIPNEFPKRNRMITLRTFFYVSEDVKSKQLYGVTLPIDYSCNVYYNGILIFSRGDIEAGGAKRIHHSESFYLPVDLLRTDTLNDLAFQLYPKEGEVNPFTKVFISGRKEADTYVFWRDLYGYKLIFALSSCALLFFVFFLFTYISRREFKQVHFLYFALMNLFFILSYINNTFAYNFADTYRLEQITRISFPLFMFSGIGFMLEYTNLIRRKYIVIILSAIVYLVATISLITEKNTIELIQAYNKYTVYTLLCGCIFLFLIGAIHFIKVRDVKSFAIALAFFLNLPAVVTDGYYFAILNVKPPLLLVPISIFGINLVIFLVLVREHSNMYHLAIAQSKELKKMNDDLEGLVKERTKQLVDNNEKLEEANITKDKFFSIIAHDLRNPFSTLIGFSDLLRYNFKDFEDSEIEEQLEAIYNISTSGYSLLENLLEWAKTQTKMIQFNPVDLNLFGFINPRLDDIKEQCKQKNIKLKNSIGKDCNVNADENLLGTILRNLLQNAIKYNIQNGEIELSCKAITDGVQISVRDTGVGIADDQLKNIFKLDKVFSTPGTFDEKGSGLGLILCKEFVEMHEGEIWAESYPERGTIVHFTIPSIH